MLTSEVAPLVRRWCGLGPLSAQWPSVSSRALACKVYSTVAPKDGDSVPAAQGPLVGIKVLDLGQVVAGNFTGTILAYFGADVIKVESPKGDALRGMRMLDETGTSLWWRCHARNKRCITVNLYTTEGQDIVRQLANKSDVLIENFRPGVMEGWGLGPKHLKQDLVYARISGYGQTGPRAKEPGYASVCEAFGGFRHINGYADRPPVRPNLSLGDTLAGLHAALGTVMALLHKVRNKGASGQVIDAAITESVFNVMEACVAEAAEGQDRQPSGSTVSGIVPSGTFRTKEGKYVVIGGNGDSVYTRLMTAIGRPDMSAENPKYATNPDRVLVEAEIMSEIEAWCAQRSLDEIIAAMNKARVPAGPILSTADILNEPQYKARGMIQSAAPPPMPGQKQQDTAKPVTMPAILPLMSGTPGATRWAGPELGQHTEEVLSSELGLTKAQIQELRDKGAI